ncbi:hypothetical protein, partial [Salmonella enterica]|uniref:hypothetical protein n=1 Tax=Salmonella enterica TaxID=28901 RepID=UPI003D2E8418
KDSEPVEDSFEIRMLIPDNYPNSLPKVFEIGDKLDPKYEHVNPDGSLCLAVPMEERQFFLKDPTLLGFVNNLIVSYFYSYCSWKKCGTFPFGG